MITSLQLHIYRIYSQTRIKKTARVKRTLFLLSTLRDKCKGSFCYAQRTPGRGSSSQQVLLVPRHVWGSAPWLFSIGCGLAHSGFHGNPSTRAIMYATASLAPPSTPSISCLESQVFTAVVDWVNHHWSGKLAHRSDPSLPRI